MLHLETSVPQHSVIHSIEFFNACPMDLNPVTSSECKVKSTSDSFSPHLPQIFYILKKHEVILNTDN